VMTIGRAKGWRGTLTATSTKVTSSRVKLTGKASITGQMVKSTTESGRTESRKATACGKVSSGTATLASGRTVKQMVMVFISGRMETDSKAAGLTVLSMVKELIFSLTKMCTLETMHLENQMGKVSTNGSTAASIPVSSKKE
jgi:hypothetical protein